MQNIAPHSQLEAAYHRADKAINQIVGLLAAARTPTRDINVKVVLSKNLKGPARRR
jgi:hypothetical protein